MAPPRRTPRRETTARTMSPKYSPREVFGTACEQASPHLYLHVMFERDDMPSCVTNKGRTLRATTFSSEIGSTPEP